jgi:D-amino peptidase
MKILISADMEGITGIHHWDQVDQQHAEYARFRKLMTQDVNAAIGGAFQAGADEVFVTDAHSKGSNILIEELNPRAHLHSGSTSPLMMIQGVQDGVDGVCLVGYHAMIGTPYATLEHTWSGSVMNMTVNDRPLGEIGLAAVISGHFNVPVLMISGDESACAEALTLIKNVETAVVKRATGRYSAEMLSPLQSSGKICEATANAVLRLKQGSAPAPVKLMPPLKLAIEMRLSEMADMAALLPGAIRHDRWIEYTAQDILTLFRAFISIQALANYS